LLHLHTGSYVGFHTKLFARQFDSNFPTVHSMLDMSYILVNEGLLLVNVLNDLFTQFYEITYSREFHDDVIYSQFNFIPEMIVA